MRYVAFFAFAGLLHVVSAHSLPNFPPPNANGYAPPPPKPKCKFVDEIKYEERCEEFKGEIDFVLILVTFRSEMNCYMFSVFNFSHGFLLINGYLFTA